MLNSKKKQLYRILSSMDEVHNDIRIRLLGENKVGIIDILTECQESAINIGEFIDKIEGEGTQTVSIIEKYCEEIYQISQNISYWIGKDKIYSNLKQYLIDIGNSIQNDLPTRYEVVFFPYKASMWDSLESIWKVAEADIDIDAYVIPIPYFDLNPDHSYGQMHYEGNQYPKDIPIYSWEQYDVEKRMPDAVFIHNPYDGTNHITSVHPNFYASNLKKHTDLLVYVPYFVALDDVEEHFCIMPATFYADKVILQSEKIKDTYVRFFGNLVKEKKLEKIFPQYKNKFIALGSPKFDKVMSTKKEECSIPNDWKRLIKDEEGKDRKVILYNTTITALLNYNEKFLDKIENVLEIFRTNKKIILLWRPHPLNIETCASMRPALLERYTSIVEKYKAEGWGIYDDTSDMNRAIAISDAYYGDWSSIVALYKATGKPIMIENIERLNEERV